MKHEMNFLVRKINVICMSIYNYNISQSVCGFLFNIHYYEYVEDMLVCDFEMYKYFMKIWLFGGRGLILKKNFVFGLKWFWEFFFLFIKLSGFKIYELK